MFNLRSSWFIRLGASLMAQAGLCILCWHQVAAQEKIRVSKGEEKVEFPGRIPKDDVLTKPFEDLKSKTESSGSLEPVLPSLPMNPRKAISKEKTEEKNWIYPKEFDQDAVLKEIFKIRDYDMDPMEKKRKTGFERILGVDVDGKASDAALTLSPLTDQKFNQSEMVGPIRPELLNRYRSNHRYDEENPSGTDLIMELSFENLLRVTRPMDLLPRAPGDLTGIVLLQNAFGQTFNKLMPARTGRSQEQVQRSKDFEKLIGYRKLAGVRFNDPVNSQGDESRQELNPVTGRKIGDSQMNGGGVLGSVESKTPDLVVGFSGISRSSFSSVLDSVNSKARDGSFTGPSAAFPSTTTPLIQPSPPVLELPRRKF